MTAFDGSVLTSPAWLPTGYTQRTDLQHPDVASSWSRTWVAPTSSDGDDLVISESPHRLPAPTGAALAGPHTVNGSPAVVTRDSSLGELLLQWALPGSSDTARITDRYPATSPTFTVAELLRIAASLPAPG